MKKIIQLSTMALICAAILFSCTKPEDGAQGPAGPAGPKGETGATGATGNAGVMMYSYGEREFTYATYYYYPATLDIDKYLVYAYYQTLSSPGWFFAQGLNISPRYEVVCYIYNYSFGISLRNVPENGSYYPNTVTWEGFRIVVVPIPDANITTVAGAATASKGAAPDYSNYAEVAKYYGLPQ